jgi:hypothetical protein
VSQVSQGTSVSLRLEVPFVVKAEPSFRIWMRTIIKRALSPVEQQNLSAKAQVIASGLGPDNIADRVISLRNGLLEDLGKDAQLKIRLSGTEGDFFMVRDERNDKSRG